MINCIVTSPTKTDAYKDVLSVTLPAFSGPIEVLSNHAESFIFLQKGSNSQNNTDYKCILH